MEKFKFHHVRIGKVLFSLQSKKPRYYMVSFPTKHGVRDIHFSMKYGFQVFDLPF